MGICTKFRFLHRILLSWEKRFLRLTKIHKKNTVEDIGVLKKLKEIRILPLEQSWLTEYRNKNLGDE